MGWFNKKEEVKKGSGIAIPSLPELPKLPDLSDIEDIDSKPDARQKDNSLARLPKFPESSFGEEFSRNAIKNAVSGDEEEDEVSDTNEFDFIPGRRQMMQKPLKETTIEVDDLEYPKKFQLRESKKEEPVFIRIDQFEESLHIFQSAKKKISEIENLLVEVKNLKEKEEKELVAWEREIVSIKKQFEMLDKEIFSKIE